MPQVTIERLGRAGDGLAGAERVPFALPGERWDLGDGPPRRLTDAPFRVQPPCRHFGRCGGCPLQHASDDFLANWKADTIVRALAARGIAAPIRPTLSSPPRSRRRAVLSARRTRKTETVGFHARRAEALVDVTECHVLRPEILAAKPVFARLAAIGATRTAELRLTVLSGPAGLDVAAAGGRPLDGDLRARLAAVAAEADLARLAWDGEPVACCARRSRRWAPPGWCRRPAPSCRRPPRARRRCARRSSEATAGARRIADLFAGCGTFALPLAGAAEVLAVEGDAAMSAALDAGWRQAPGLRPVEARTRDLFRRPLLAAEFAGIEAVVIDPPRAGAEAQSRELARSGVARVAAVSCDPASFARDAAILVGGGFTLDWVQPVDQFRWSGHVELAAGFSR